MLSQLLKLTFLKIVGQFVRFMKPNKIRIWKERQIELGKNSDTETGKKWIHVETEH